MIINWAKHHKLSTSVDYRTSGYDFSNDPSWKLQLKELEYDFISLCRIVESSVSSLLSILWYSTNHINTDVATEPLKSKKSSITILERSICITLRPFGYITFLSGVRINLIWRSITRLQKIKGVFNLFLNLSRKKGKGEDALPLTRLPLIVYFAVLSLFFKHLIKATMAFGFQNGKNLFLKDKLNLF